MDFLSNRPKHGQIWLLTELDNSFESNYLAARGLEKRIYSDAQVQFLPFESPVLEQKKEWKMRSASVRLFFERAKKENFQPQKILDLGCGNGWFTSILAKKMDAETLGLDINLTELKQATRLFSNENCQFAYGDIFKANLPNHFFEAIFLNASAQYFQDFERLGERLLALLSEKNGSRITILDTPFYAENEVAEARERTRQHYFSVGLNEVAEHYFHRNWAELDDFEWKSTFGGPLFFEKMTEKMARFFSKKARPPFPQIELFGKRK